MWLCPARPPRLHGTLLAPRILRRCHSNREASLSILPETAHAHTRPRPVSIRVYRYHHCIHGPICFYSSSSVPTEMWRPEAPTRGFVAVSPNLRYSQSIGGIPEGGPGEMRAESAEKPPPRCLAARGQRGSLPHAPQLPAFSPGKEQAAGVWETCLAPGWPHSSYDGDLSLPLGLALGSPIFPSG